MQCLYRAHWDGCPPMPDSPPSLHGPPREGGGDLSSQNIRLEQHGITLRVDWLKIHMIFAGFTFIFQL